MNHTWQEIHALAIGAHKEAFDAEAQRAANAGQKWQEALSYWGELFRMEEFWVAVEARGRLLEPSFSRLAELKSVLPKFLLEIHASFVLDYIIKRDRARARYHLELIRGAQLGATPEASAQLREEALQQIYQPRLREDLLEQNEEKEFEAAFDLAQPLHSLDPTAVTAAYMLKIYFDWVRKYENEQVDLIQQNYPEYAEITAKMETEEDDFEYVDFADELFAEIREDEDIQALQEAQAELMEDLEAAADEARYYCKPLKPSHRHMLSQALYFIGRHYCTREEERDLDGAVDYLEEAIEIDPTNNAAVKLLDELNEVEAWE